jgi:hypothetical protein
MSKKETNRDLLLHIKTKIAIIETENKHQTKVINEVKSDFKQHDKDSVAFRKQCDTNTNDIKWIKRIFVFVVTGGGAITLCWKYLRDKLGG